MKVEQIYTGCLAEAAYYIESEGEAAIIDPLRETEPYLSRATQDNAKIKYVLETHFHADFVSGHLDLAKKTGAQIVYGPTAKPNFDALVAEDDQVLTVGKVKIKVLHTPGHTMESSTFLLIDEEGKDYAIFTGDTLFIGDVGRPDLAVKSDLTREDLAGHLFDSLRNKIMPLADEVIVYPGHGAGSACGKKMSNETFATLGQQKQMNYALRADMTREEFVKEVTDGLVAPPQYFPKNAVMNKMGYDSIDEVMERGTQSLDLAQFENLMLDEKTLVLDTRDKHAFAAGFIPGSMFVGIDGSFATWVGTLIMDLEQPLLIVADEGREEEVVTRLARVGYDNAQGFLNGGFDTWKNAGKPVDTIDEVSAEEFMAALKREADGKWWDVRKASEYASQHIEGISNLPLDFFNSNMKTLDAGEKHYLHCQSGFRSLIAASMLKANGLKNVVNVLGGFKALKELGAPITEFEEQITAL